ncbi:MAG: tRNA-dihydrouridine synthase family protein [Calditerrivibrio sp.]|nr:tRNA-dihydrouridine synthase family protein [Calditerrivibrio sp.]
MICVLLDKEPLVGAPLAGITNLPFRKIVRKYHKGLIFTEMISVEGIKRNNRQTLKLIDVADDENPIGIQIFGGNPESYPSAIRIIEDHFNFFCFDINMGCPVKKVIKAKSGAYLLTDLKLAKEIVCAARKATHKPLLVKTRLGWNQENYVYREMLKICEGEGVDAITIHGRTKSQLYSGTVNYDAIAEIKSIAKIPIIGNGDVVDPVSLKKMQDTGVDGIMIGRGMMKSPWIFEALKHNKNPIGYLSSKEIVDILFLLLEEEKRYRENRYFLSSFKKFAVWFSKGYKNSTLFREKIYSVGEDERAIRDLIIEFYLE